MTVIQLNGKTIGSCDSWFVSLIQCVYEKYSNVYMKSTEKIHYARLSITENG